MGMKTVLTSVVGLFVWIAAAPAIAQDDAPPAQREKKICQTEKMTGSLTRVRRICLTRAEWDDLRIKTKHSFDEKIGGASGGCQAPTNVLSGAMCGSP